MEQYRMTPDGVQARALHKEEMVMLEAARARMTNVRAPVFLEDPLDRLFFVAMDGTANSSHKDPPERHTVVARIRVALEELDDPAIGVVYVEGVGTQSKIATSTYDGAAGETLSARAEQAYLELCLKVFQWQAEHPDVRIRVAGTGFSRGAESTALLANLIHERGIRDPSGVHATYDEDNVLTSVKWRRLPPLVAPGHVPTAFVLIDPVATGQLDTERKIPSSNVGLVQFTSPLEPRDFFSSTQHAMMGMSDQGRVANIQLPGVHSDLGGSYLLDGVGRVVYNFQVAYFNTVIGAPRLQQVPEASDPRLFAIHRSEQHLYGMWTDFLYQFKGQRTLHQNLGPSCRKLVPAPCTRDPVDHRLADTLKFEYVHVGRNPGGTDAKMEAAMAAVEKMYRRDPGVLDAVATYTRLPGRAQLLQQSQDLGELFEGLVDSARRNDLPGMKEAAALFRATPAGMLMDNIDAARRLLDAVHERGAAPIHEAETAAGPDAPVDHQQQAQASAQSFP